MRAEGSLTIDYRRYRQLVLASTGPRPWLLRVLGLLLVVLVVVLAALGHRGEYWWVLYGLLLTGVHEIGVLIGWRRTADLARARPWRYEVSDTAVSIVTIQSEVRVSWDAISRARRKKNAWVLKVRNTGRNILIPRAAFSPADQAVVDTLCSGAGRAVGRVTGGT